MPKIFVESKTVAGETGNELGVLLPVVDSKHLFLVFQDDDGSERVIRGGPEYDNPFAFGNIKTQTDVNLFDTRDSPIDASGLASAQSRIELDLQGQYPYAVWNNMIAHANVIGASNMPYSAYVDAQNSNSLIASVMNAVGFDVATNLPPGSSLSDFPGISNLLDFHSNFNIPDSFSPPSGNLFAQGFMPAGWNTMPSLELPDFNADYNAAMDLSLPDLNAGGPFAADPEAEMEEFNNQLDELNSAIQELTLTRF
jgi:hypothetical protein